MTTPEKTGLAETLAAVRQILARRALPIAGREAAIRAVHDLEATSADPSVEEYVDAVLAALPTAGRVVEAERVAEQVEALRLLIEAPSLTGPTTGEAVYVSELRPIYAALAAAIRAGGAE